MVKEEEGIPGHARDGLATIEKQKRRILLDLARRHWDSEDLAR
jgi:hypothetical protein